LRRLTIRYPPAHPVTIILIATATLALPNTLPTTVGIVEKNPPLETPFTTTNNARGPNVVDPGQIANILTAVNAKERNSVLSAPNRSQRRPQQIRPMAEARLKPATRPAPTLDENPRDFV